ncbi:MAG: alpha/beta fold hydrolase [Hellea sp.]
MSLPKMTKVRRQYVDGPFGQVHVHIATPKTPSAHNPLICLHQSPKSSREFRRFLQTMDDRIVIAIDNPGHGESDTPLQVSDATIENYAASAWAALKSLGYKTVDILGHHTGAKVACEMAFQEPTMVGGIVMISALVLTPEERDAFKAEFMPIPLDEEGTRFQHMWAQSIKYRGHDVTLEQLAFSMAENLRAGEAYEWGHAAAFNYTDDFAERIRTLPHRITVLNPKDMLFGYTPRVGKLLQNGEVIDHPEWGFGFIDVDTEGAVNAVKEALS